MSDIVRLAVAIVVPQLVGIGAALATARAVSRWYPTLERPSWEPPEAAIGPVWTLLYLLMGIASFLVWKEGLDIPVVRWALQAYAVQLALNAAWPLLFFRLRSPLAGLVDLGLLWMALVVTVLLFFQVGPAAGWLMVPYLVWTSYAGALNLSIWLRNR